MEVTQDRECCIGCGACVAVDPGHWALGDDSKSRLINVKGLHKKDGKDVATVDPPGQIEESADVCPVGCIKIKK